MSNPPPASAKVTFATDLTTAVDTVVADYTDDNGGTNGLTRAQIVEACLADTDHDEVNDSVSHGDTPLAVAAAYHQLITARDTDPASLDRAAHGPATIQTGQPVQFRTSFCWPTDLRGT